MDYFTSEPMKYYAPAASMNKEAKQLKLESMAESGQYLYGLKTDGNWSRAVITAERAALQTRGISKKTGTYGEVQTKVFFWDDVVKAFNKGTTVILGEIFLPGKIDKDIGSILRCLDDKAIARQKDEKLRWRIFDILALDGIDYMNTHFEQRIQLIDKVVSRINSPLVEGVKYYEMDNNFFDKMEEIFSAGGEGAVCYKKDSVYIPGRRGPHAWDTCKVKQEISNDIDCFIIGTEPAVQSYTGKDLCNWKYWINKKTNQKVIGNYFGEYQLGGVYLPISKGYYYNWPGAVYVGVFDSHHEIYSLCKVAGLTEDLKSELRDNFDEWYMCPITIGGMMISEANGISIRHPYIKSIRREDISPEDCTLEKILS